MYLSLIYKILFLWFQPGKKVTYLVPAAPPFHLSNFKGHLPGKKATSSSPSPSASNSILFLLLHMVSTFVLTYVWALLDFDWSKQQSSQEEEQQQQQQPQHLPFTYQPLKAILAAIQNGSLFCCSIYQCVRAWMMSASPQICHYILAL